MPGLSLQESVFLAICLEGLFYGLYTAIFAIFLKYHLSRNGPDGGQTTTIVFYSLCTLYVFSIILFATNIAEGVLANFASVATVYPTVVLSSTLNGCCDFMAQSVLIYRCWIIWNRDIRVVIVPSILAVVFLILWIPGGIFCYTPTPNWVYNMTVTSLVLTLIVNALVTGLIVFRILRVYIDLKSNASHVSGGSRLRPIMFILIESGMALFSFQLANIVLYFTRTEAATIVAQPFAYILQMLNGITPTIIQVRVAMGLSFHNEKSLVEVASTLCFGNDYLTEMDNIALRRDDDSAIQVIEVCKAVRVVGTQ